jgi:hypothetical protein
MAGDRRCRVDVITWRPGRVGKGWLFPDGTVRAWSVNAREQPHHAEIEHPAGALRFRLSTDGVVELHGDQTRLSLIAAALAAARRQG